ncbi:hypothetical protein VPHD63_0013 [Vibrio phage D63]
MRIAMYLKRPVFEVHMFPNTELDYWSCYFSIEDNQDEPILTKEESRQSEIDKCVAQYAAVFGGDDGQSLN